MTTLNTIIEEEKKETEKLTNMVVRIMRGMYNSNEARIADVRSAITNSRTTAMQRAYEAGRNDAVDFIDQEFNDDRYAQFSEYESDDEMSVEEEAEFRMFWSNLLQSARITQLKKEIN